jgi:hypothetical protein
LIDQAVDSCLFNDVISSGLGWIMFVSDELEMTWQQVDMVYVSCVFPDRTERSHE